MNGEVPSALINLRPYRQADFALAAPTPPELLAPEDSEDISGMAVFDWSDVAGSTHYHVQVARDVDFSQVVWERTSWPALRIGNGAGGRRDLLLARPSGEYGAMERLVGAPAIHRRIGRFDR